jgi:hypothetical protein
LAVQIDTNEPDFNDQDLSPLSEIRKSPDHNHLNTSGEDLFAARQPQPSLIHSIAPKPAEYQTQPRTIVRPSQTMGNTSVISGEHHGSRVVRRVSGHFEPSGVRRVSGGAISRTASVPANFKRVILGKSTATPTKVEPKRDLGENENQRVEIGQDGIKRIYITRPAITKDRQVADARPPLPSRPTGNVHFSQAPVQKSQPVVNH